jgi:hypothetical protein
MMMSDKKLNEYIDHLLSWSQQKRIDSDGSWDRSFDGAMAMWVDRHPGTRPPAYAKIGPPPACFTGTIPPIFEGDLE